MTALALAALIACALVGLGLGIGWALHADNARRTARPATIYVPLPNPPAGHSRVVDGG